MKPHKLGDVAARVAREGGHFIGAKPRRGRVRGRTIGKGAADGRLDKGGKLRRRDDHNGAGRFVHEDSQPRGGMALDVTLVRGRRLLLFVLVFRARTRAAHRAPYLQGLARLRDDPGDRGDAQFPGTVPSARASP